MSRPAVHWRGAVPLALALLLCSGGSARAAIAFVAASTNQTSGATSLGLGKPSGVAAGEVEIATISVPSSATISAPSGWTSLINTPLSTSLREASFWHVATSTEGTTTFSFGASVAAAGGIAAYSGVDTTTIVDVAASRTGTSGTSATVPSVTTTYGGDLVLGAGAFNNTGTLTASGSTIKRYSATVAATGGPAILGEDVLQASAGASAVQTISDSASATAWIGQAIALKAASAGGVLSVSTSAAPTFSADLDLGDQTPTYTVPLTTTASISPAPGWNETITSTEFSSGTHTLATSASTIAAAPTIVCNTAFANCTAATNS